MTYWMIYLMTACCYQMIHQEELKTKQGDKDDFYSSLAAMATSDGESDKSEVDMDKLVHSLGVSFGLNSLVSTVLV
ncbi:hypothetical protein Btru_059009 [Bulinus truncatus]|nr:hypothetical protein Btru_059009 [Bulinus truncatus]